MRLKPRLKKRSDLSYELTLISKNIGESLEKITNYFWELMLRNEENIEDSEERGIASINYLSRIY